MKSAIPFSQSSNTIGYNSIARLCVWICIAETGIFLVNNYLIFWLGFPGALALFGDSHNSMLSVLQFASYIIAALIPALYIQKTKNHTAIADYQRLIAACDFIARFAFWAVFTIGISDVILSLMRNENWLPILFPSSLADNLTRSAFRGPYLHMPLLVVALVIAWRVKSIGFHWLAALVVAAEFAIVISRFIFSYEQPFMGDLVRFWYAALFLFASAYTLWHEGHVRVDVFYTKFSVKRKALTNIIGCTLLGIPICWVVLARGMWDKTHIINAPLLNYEVSQSGFGMYVKYLMAGFLIIYAVTMMLAFCAYLLKNVAILNGDEAPPQEDEPEISEI